MTLFSCSDDRDNGVETRENTVHFDGIYRSDLYFDTYWRYLKFYSDGTVIKALSTLEPEEAYDLWDKDSNWGIGEYTITDDHLEFTIIDEDIIVDYEGSIKDNGNKLSLHWYSHANNNDGTWNYTFFEVSLAKE